jgi:hypothetical protein
MSRPGRFGQLVMGLLALAVPALASAQPWSVDVSAGRIAYDPVVGDIGTNSLVAGIRYDAERGTWVNGAIAPALGERHPFWASAGAGVRLGAPLSSRRMFSAGLDLGGDVFAFGDPVVDRSGRGATVDALPFARVSSGPAYVDGFGGFRAHTLSVSGATQNRRILETGARAGYQSRLGAQVEMRFVRADEATYPFVGGLLRYDGTPVQIWAHAGKWLSDVFSDETYGAGGSVSLDAATTVWISLRQDAPDPLYWNVGRRTWSVGISRRLGRPRPPIAATAPLREAGDVVIRVPATEAPGEDLFVAGDFNNWQPVHMRREAGEWVIRLSLDAGVYNYAFRSDNGDWFVPASVQGRRDDGMGGHVAVLVVL